MKMNLNKGKKGKIEKMIINQGGDEKILAFFSFGIKNEVDSEKPRR